MTGLIEALIYLTHGNSYPWYANLGNLGKKIRDYCLYRFDILGKLVILHLLRNTITFRVCGYGNSRG